MPSAHAAKPYVGITGIEIAAPDVQCEHWYGRNQSNRNDCFQDIVRGFSKMLETAIVQTNKMDVFERDQLTPVLNEQLAAQAGLTKGEAKIGGLEGIDFIFSGSITKFGAKTDESGVSGEVLSLFGGGAAQGLLSKGIKQTKTTFVMAVDIKIVDVATGKIVAAETVESEIVAGESSSIAGVGEANNKAAPLSDVARETAGKIAALIVQNKFPIRIISVKNDVLSINYNNSVLSEGQCLNVYTLGEEIVAPDTGESLGSEEELVGEIAITETNSKFSKGAAITDFVPEKGMIARQTECADDKKNESANQKPKKRGADW